MVKSIFALNGSLRRNSSNGKFLDCLKEIFTEAANDKKVILDEGLDRLPHFNPDLEMPDVVLEFKRKINEADYLLIVTPEYAHGIPGVLKNALDWLVSDEKLLGKNVILFICSAGDGKHAMDSLVEITKTMSLNVLEERCFSIAGIRSKFQDSKLDSEVEEIIKSLACEL